MRNDKGPSRRGPARDIYHGHPDTSLHGAGRRAEGLDPDRGPGPRTGGRVPVPPARRIGAPAPARVTAVPRMPAPVPGEELPENLIAGRNPIREALRTNMTIDRIVVARGPLSGAAREIIEEAREKGIVVQETDRARLDQVYSAHQGMLAYLAAVEYSDVSDMLDLARERNEDPFLIILDGITDPHNLGAVIRTAECAGAHGVILPKMRSAGLGPACAKAAAGALSHMPIARVTNLTREIEELKKKGIWVIGTAMNGENAFEADLTGPCALVIGSEGDGISRLVLEKCDRVISLPMKGEIGSLNASVAAGILMYRIMSERAE